jgi:RNA polymerase sigma factor (sigma-70 family)
MVNRSETEDLLVRRIEIGDPLAAPMLVSILGDQLLSLVHSEAPRTSDAQCERVLTLALESGIESFEEFTPGSDTALSWFAARVRSRSRQWVQAGAPVRVGDEGAKRFGTSLFRSGLAGAIATLDDRDRLVLALRSWQGFAHSVIADHLGIKEGTVRQQSKRALGRLHSSIGASELLRSRLKARGPDCDEIDDRELKLTIEHLGYELFDAKTRQSVEDLLRYDHPVSPEARRRLIVCTRRALRLRSIQKTS